VTAFVDPSGFFAGVDRSDAHHERASFLLTSEERLLTTDHVLVETWGLIQRHIGTSTADGFWEGLRLGHAQIEFAKSADLERAWAIGELFADQGFSIVDRTSFAVMERLGVYRVITFDDDFAIYRFGRKRDRAFEVLR
jgi:predicted nucleic acid-binding protein